MKIIPCQGKKSGVPIKSTAEHLEGVPEDKTYCLVPFDINYREGGVMSDKINDVERELNRLELELEKERIARTSDRKLFIIVAGALAVFFGYNTFWQVPKAITSAVSETAAKTATDRIGALKKEVEEQIYPAICAMKTTIDTAKKDAEASAVAAGTAVKEAEEKWLQRNNADIKKLKCLLPKPTKMSVVFSSKADVIKNWCIHEGGKTSWADVNGDGYADALCDDNKGRHWVALSKGDGTFKRLGKLKDDWCQKEGAITSWADVNGDRRADMICDEPNGEHWVLLSNLES